MGEHPIEPFEPSEMPPMVRWWHEQMERELQALAGLPQSVVESDPQHVTATELHILEHTQRSKRDAG